jgi:hypothetical protein
MTDTSGPFDGGAGATSTTEAEWRNLFSGRPPGVIQTNDVLWDLNTLTPFADSTGMQIKVKSGRACINGFWFHRDAEAAVPIAAADATNPRIDLVVLRFDPVANSVSVAVQTGVPNAGPVVPLPVQGATIWEVPLAEVAVAAASSTVAASAVRDRRQYYGSVVALVTKTATQSLTNGVAATVTFDQVSGPSGAALWVVSAPTRFTCRMAGYYALSAWVPFAANAAGQRSVSFLLNGAGIIADDTRNAAAAGASDFSVASVPYPLAVGDYVEVLAVQSSGGALNLSAGARFGLHWVGY